ncbi:MAG: LysR family transcriptional regulator [Pseudomonadota bacterium]|jgi:DNA-binding transcriptional LysR family regulator
MDWDKLRIFHAAAEAGSFTHAGAALGLSQSAVSRQVSALEQDLAVPLFHRHARGLILTEQGELLLRTVREVTMKLDTVQAGLADSREKPHGELRVTATYGIGTNWLTPRLGQFLELYPDIKVRVILSEDELDLGMREADVALRLREPIQPDLIRRRLFTMHYHLYASAEYLARHGEPQTIEDLDKHRLLAFAAPTASFLESLNALLTVGRDAKAPREAALSVNNITALRRAVENSVGIAVLPDYHIEAGTNLVQLLPQAVTSQFDCYVVYAEEMRNVARVQVFRDFLVAGAQRWRF